MAPHGPVTRSSLAGDLVALGVRPGDTLLVHSSLRSLGWVCGGQVAVVQALLDAVGPQGTLVVPAQTPDNRDPSRWSHHPVPESWWPAIRAQLPAFDPAVTPCRAMGIIAETVRTWPGAARSAHPQTSFAAVGARARDLVAVHALSSELGEQSPLAALEAAGARALLLGVGYDRCTAFHLAEYRLPDPPSRTGSCVVNTSAGRQWVSYQGVRLDDRDFVPLGEDLERTGVVSRGLIGAATARLIPVPEAIRFATGWLLAHRRAVA